VWAKAIGWLEQIPGVEYWALMLLMLSTSALMGLPLPRETGELRVRCDEVERIEEGGRGVVIANHLEFPPLCHSDPMCWSGAQTVLCDGHEIVMFRTPRNAPFEPGPGPHALLLSRPGTFFVAEDLCVGCTDFEAHRFEAAGWRIAAAVAVAASFFLFVLAHRGRIARRRRALEFIRSAPSASRALDEPHPSVRLQVDGDDPALAHAPHMSVRDGELVACDPTTEPRIDLGLTGFRGGAREPVFVGPGTVNGLEVAPGASHALDHGDVLSIGDHAVHVHAGERRLLRYRLDGDSVRIFEISSFAGDLVSLLLVASVAVAMIRVALAGLGVFEGAFVVLAVLFAWKVLPALRRRFVTPRARSIDRAALRGATVARVALGLSISKHGATIEELAGGETPAERALVDALYFEAQALLKE
jgi:hypothetical protein